MTELISKKYGAWLANLKNRIQSAQQRSSLSVNRELVLLYWSDGQDILDLQQVQGWGAKVVEQLAKAIKQGWGRDVLALQLKSNLSALLARIYWLFEALGFKIVIPVTRGILGQTSVAGKQWLLAEILSLDSVLLSGLSYLWRGFIWR